MHVYTAYKLFFIASLNVVAIFWITTIYNESLAWLSAILLFEMWFELFGKVNTDLQEFIFFCSV